MKVKLQQVLPEEIEKRSFEIISQELGGRPVAAENEPVIKRVIHTSADFDYYDNLVFSEGAVRRGIEALKQGALIVTDTQMAKAGINKTALSALGGRVECFVADEDVKAQAKANQTTRSAAAVEKAAALAERESRPVIFAVGNAPTALVRICELVSEGRLSPALVIGVPVGFVNVVESKELLLQTDVSHIAARGRKGGSNVAAAICNAMLYMIRDGK